MEKIKINSIIEIAGKPEAHVTETLEKMMDILKKNDKITIVKNEIAPTKKVEMPHPSNPEEKVEIYSSFVDLELDFPSLDELMQFCFAFMPSSIEVVEPKALKIDQKDLENPLNDLLGRLHHQAKIIMEYSALKQQIEKFQPQKTSSSQKEN
jgi:hypothetical protein